MKFGQYLLDNKYAEWADQYLNYDQLKKIIKSLEQVLYYFFLLCTYLYIPCSSIVMVVF